MKATAQNNAGVAYYTKAQSINKLLTRLQAAADAGFFHDEGGNKHWGHVGDLAHIEEQLQRIADQIYKEGEFAPENKAGAK